MVNDSIYKYSAVVTSFMFLALSLFFLYTVDDNNRITGFATTDAALGNLSVGVQTFVSCSWSTEALNITFGTGIDPDNSVNATANFNMTEPANGTYYNVTVTGLTNVDVNVTIRGSNLTSGGVNIIGVGNITWAGSEINANHTEMNYTDSINLTGTYDYTNYIGDAMSAGTTAYYRVWLYVPSGTPAGSYAGNYTTLCQEE